MRLNRLALIRYGHFTDRVVDLPAAAQDIHVVVGPNEAGKSTLRAAILDLLYGFPKNTPHAFVHNMPDLRLGAALDLQGERLDIIRTKGNKQTLRDGDDQPLADNALDASLGNLDKASFTQMFSLDHDRLVQGGHSMLSASNNLGQILFQSAAGIAGLGEVRKALEAEADQLWARRKSGDRAYYIAADALDQATAALKQATVRTRDWAEAQSQVSALDSALDGLRQQHAQVRQRRSVLERVRRVLPHLNTLDELVAQTDALGPAAELPADAAMTLATAARAIASAATEQLHQAEQVAQAQAVLDGLQIDQALRTLGADVNALNEQRLQYRGHAAELQKQRAAMAALWGQAAGLAAELGWQDLAAQTAGNVDQANTLRARLPRLDQRSGLTRLHPSRSSLHAALAAAERSDRAKRAEIEQSRAALARLPAADVPAGLQAALQRARQLGDAGAALAERRQAVQQRQAALESASASLGPWRAEMAAVRAMSVPDAETVSGYNQAQLADELQRRALLARVQALTQQRDAAHLAHSQYRQAHQPVGRDELLQARQTRDRHWQALQDDVALVATQGAEFGHQVQATDRLADRRHDTVKEAAELRQRQDQLEQLEQALGGELWALEALDEGATARDKRWAALMQSCSLPGLPSQAAQAWLQTRAAVLAAESPLQAAQQALQTLVSAIDDTSTALATELASAGAKATPVAAADQRLPVLVVQAQAHVDHLVDSRGQRKTLGKQLADAERDQQLLADEARRAQAALDDWSAQWAQALAQTGLGAHTTPSQAEAFLDTCARIDAALADMRRIQTEQIDQKTAELQDHAQAARALAERAAPELASLPATDIALQLVARLNLANEAHSEAERQRVARQAAQRRLDDAVLKAGQAQASLAPLVQRAGLTSDAGRGTDDVLAQAVARSDQRRAWLAASAAADKAARDAGDGLNLTQLRAESATIDATALVAELAELTTSDHDLVNQHAELAARRQAASSTLLAMGGTADAAKAEARRQEALAQMADAVERYLKVYTGAKLLRWAIEQYREAQQGPMLSAASDIFARLTLDSFERLTVDFDKDPPTLLARRPGGGLVSIEGLSEGTRDQLYLALRLAALHMHLDKGRGNAPVPGSGQAQALPFIADDLFINYDDARATAGLQALGELSRQTQVLFLTHHAHLLPAVQSVFGAGVNIVRL